MTTATASTTTTTTTETPLTKKQEKIYQFICRFYVRTGFAPTLREIGLRTGIGTFTNGVMCHINSLLRKGWVEGVRMGRGGACKSTGSASMTYVPVKRELVATVKGDEVKIGMSGPGVTMSRQEWMRWLSDRMMEMAEK